MSKENEDPQSVPEEVPKKCFARKCKNKDVVQHVPENVIICRCCKQHTLHPVEE